jgi:hypothetical protein
MICPRPQSRPRPESWSILCKVHISKHFGSSRYLSVCVCVCVCVYVCVYTHTYATHHIYHIYHLYLVYVWSISYTYYIFCIYYVWYIYDIYDILTFCIYNAETLLCTIKEIQINYAAMLVALVLIISPRLRCPEKGHLRSCPLSRVVRTLNGDVSQLKHVKINL